MADLILAKFSTYFTNPKDSPVEVDDNPEGVFILGNCRNFGDGQAANQNRAMFKAGGWHLLTWLKPKIDLEWKYCICHADSHEIRVEENISRTMKFPPNNPDYALWICTNWESETYTVTEVPIEDIMEEDEDLMEFMNFEEPDDGEIENNDNEDEHSETDSENKNSQGSEENKEMDEQMQQDQSERTESSENSSAKNSFLSGTVQGVLHQERNDSFDESKSRSETSTDSEIVAIFSGQQQIILGEQEIDRDFGGHCTEHLSQVSILERSNLTEQPSQKYTQESKFRAVSDEEVFLSQDAEEESLTEKTPEASFSNLPNIAAINAANSSGTKFFDNPLDVASLTGEIDKTKTDTCSNVYDEIRTDTVKIISDPELNLESCPSPETNILNENNATLPVYENQSDKQKNTLQELKEKCAIYNDSINNKDNLCEEQDSANYALITSRNELIYSELEPRQYLSTEQESMPTQKIIMNCKEDEEIKRENTKKNENEISYLPSLVTRTNESSDVCNDAVDKKNEKDKQTINNFSDFAREGDALAEVKSSSHSVEKFNYNTTEHPKSSALEIENISDASQRQASWDSDTPKETLYDKENNPTCQLYSLPETTQVREKEEQKTESCATTIDSSIVHGDSNITVTTSTNRLIAGELQSPNTGALHEEIQATSSRLDFSINTSCGAKLVGQSTLMESSEIQSDLPVTEHEAVEDAVVDSFMPSTESKCPSTQRDVVEEDDVIKPTVTSETESTCPVSSIPGEEVKEEEDQEIMEAQTTKPVSSRPVSEMEDEEIAYGSMDEVSQEMTSSIDGRVTDMSSDMTSSGVVVTASMCTSNTADSFAPTGFTSGDDTPHLDEEDEDNLSHHKNGLVTSDSSQLTLSVEDNEMNTEKENEEESSGECTPSATRKIPQDQDYEHNSVEEISDVNSLMPTVVENGTEIADAPVIQNVIHEFSKETISISQEAIEQEPKEIMLISQEVVQEQPKKESVILHNGATVVDSPEHPPEIIAETQIVSLKVKIEEAGPPPPIITKDADGPQTPHSPVVVGVSNHLEKSEDEDLKLSHKSKVIVNDDYKYPDSVTPTKVEHFISTADYDVPYIDDDAFYCEDWYVNEDQRWSWLEKDYKADFDECTLTAGESPYITSMDGKLLEAIPGDRGGQKNTPLDNRAPARRRGLRNLCGCVSRQ